MDALLIAGAFLFVLMTVGPKGPTSFSMHASRGLVRRGQWISDRARSMGIRLVAGKGSGKSRLMGRVIAYLDFLRGVPQVILDPVGGTIDNFLDRLTLLPRTHQERLWRRVKYVDMSGRSGYVVPMPLYYRLGGESLSEIAGRYLQAVRRIDPFLQTASIEGWNALWRVGTYAGMVLAALGHQITEVESLLNLPELWEERMERARRRYPELAPAVDFFAREYKSWGPNTRDRRTASFRTKAALFLLDPTMRAMFGAPAPGIDWQEVEEEGAIVLLDFRREHDLERRRFKMYWAFAQFLEYIKHRGPGRHRPIGLIIDELAALASQEALGSSVFAADLDEFINVIARNYMVWPTVAHQELWQVGERLQKTLATMGTQIIGVTSDPESAVMMARQHFRYDPYRVKKVERVWMSDMMFGAYVVDHRTVEFTPEEQMIMASQAFMDLGRFRFLVRPAPGEGNVTGKLRAVSIADVDRGLYPDGALVAAAREQLVKRSGRPVESILAQIEARTEPPPVVISGQKRPSPQPTTADDGDGLYGA